MNYLAGFLLTDLLLPLIVKSAPAQIVHVASAGQYPLDFTNLMLTRAYSGMRAYAQSKLAQVMFTFDLAQQLAGTEVSANCLHPASLMDTRMVRETGTKPTSTVEEGTRAVCAGVVAAGADRNVFQWHTAGASHEQAYEEAARCGCGC